MDIKWKNNKIINLIIGIVFLISSTLLLLKVRDIKYNYEYQHVISNNNNIYNDSNILNYISMFDSNLLEYFRDYTDLNGTLRTKEIESRIAQFYPNYTAEEKKVELERLSNKLSNNVDDAKMKFINDDTNLQYYIEDTEGNFITNIYDDHEIKDIKSNWDSEYYYIKSNYNSGVLSSNELKNISYNMQAAGNGNIFTSYVSRYYRIPKQLTVNDYLYEIQSKYYRITDEHNKDEIKLVVLITISVFSLILYIINLYINYKRNKKKVFILRAIEYICKLYNESRIVKSTHYKVIIVLVGILLLILAGGIVGHKVATGWIYYGRISITVMACVLYIIGYLVFVVTLLLKLSGNLNKVKLATDNIVKGNYNQDIEIKGPYVLKSIGENVKNIDDGLEKAISEAIKSEKMKSELISNVSHDLKTPLTSILNYVDFLKREDISEEDKIKYINILDKKSKRLKVLIDDLFEASKAATGNLELNMENIEITALLRQTLGEFEEKIEESNLTFIKKLPEEKVYLRLDGRKTWRIFENLIGNILKYSLDNSRVYIDIIEEEDKVIITMKNVSNHILDFTGEEAVERFKRGDDARTTEGSGLGLAIAKNLVNLQGGSFKIDIDGDLFKAIIEFKK